MIKNLIFSVIIDEIYAQPQSVSQSVSQELKTVSIRKPNFSFFKQFFKPFIDAADCGIQSEFSMREICKIRRHLPSI